MNNMCRGCTRRKKSVHGASALIKFFVRIAISSSFSAQNHRTAGVRKN